VSKYIHIIPSSGFFEVKERGKWPQGQAEARQAKPRQKGRRKKKKVRLIPLNLQTISYFPLLNFLYIMKFDYYISGFSLGSFAVVPTVLDITVITPYDSQVILKVPFFFCFF
jgi:hypothetical protein